MAASPSNTIKLQKTETELIVHFQIDDLASCFSRSSSSKYTEHFGPGLRFGSYSFVDAKEPSHIGLYLYTSREYPPMIVSWNVAMKALNGNVYSTKSMSYTFKSGEAIGWSKFLTSDAFDQSANMKAENTILIHATLKFTPQWPITLKPTLDVLHRAVLGKSASNVRFVAYGKRNAKGRLGGPCTLFVTREAMEKSSDKFKDLMDDRIDMLCGCVSKYDSQEPRTAYTTYRDSDSDFEDDPLASDQDDIEMADPQSRAANSSSATIEYSTSAHSRTNRAGDTPIVKAEPFTSDPTLQHATQSSNQTFTVLGIAANTWEAILYWLYTGVVVFAPLTTGGKVERDAFIQQYRTANPDRPAPVSCKSVYRIADALGIEDLKKRAVEHLTAQLSMQTYLHELFSEFTSKYEEIRKLEMLAVIKHWDDLKSSPALKEKMFDVVSGKLPHAGPLLADLLLRTSIKEEIDNAKK